MGTGQQETGKDIKKRRQQHVRETDRKTKQTKGNNTKMAKKGRKKLKGKRVGGGEGLHLKYSGPQSSNYVVSNMWAECC